MKQHQYLKKTLWLLIAGACLTPAMVLAQFIYPVSGTVPSGGEFGACRDGCSRKHAGLDISGSTGTLVGAGYAGTVAFSGISCGLTCGYGRVVYINHASNYQTRYAHNDSNLVSVGDNVVQNQNIAHRGNTGGSTGPHVHYEIRRDGTALYIPGSSGDSITRNTPVPYSYPGLSSSIGAGGIIVDNGSSGFSASSNWFTSTNVSGYYGSNYHVRATESVSDAATWNFQVHTRGDYEVFARWTSASDRASAAPYIIHHSGGSTTVTVDQTQNGGQWMSLGTHRFGGTNPTNHSVQLSCWTSSGAYVIADAIRLVPKVVWVDNHHSGFSASSNWGTATWASDKYGPDYRFRDTEAVSDAATWTAQHLTAGSYQVQAWWSAASNRATSAPYIVHHSSGTTSVAANQTINGGQWQTLGTFTLDAGENKVQLSCWTSSGDVVVADAIRWRLQ